MIEIVPYYGFGNFNFQMPFDEVCKLLKANQVKYQTEHWPNKGCTPEVAWDIIRIGKDVSLFFAKGKMFKAYFENAFPGMLTNGIRLGMTIEEAQQIDPSIVFDDWEETYASDQGYWLEDDAESGKIISIAVFIKELEDDDTFFKYEWCVKEEGGK